ncbi:hypothetical protein MmTuc01_0161 [Methanosarcina mazei Tuc01]|uniref:Tetratricopeptide repeat protein n=1 Tax=Methanosarcina mazei Tuc01 TaxID=1236903 RepID=M1PTY4_METMZ|nr:tetratricopeptide repeat protein [Methanosarcina mazei]AGF95616.1 hypothetical protein MmTuc01_0161 [Methanosarcina mazei Tuc01]
MSRQFADKIQRILETSLVQINTGKTKKAFENLAKAEKLLDKAKRPDYQCSILMLKGRAFLAEQRNEEALQEFQKLMEFSVPLFLDAPENPVHQYYVYNSFGFTIKALSEIDSVSKMEEYFYRDKKYFDKIFAAYDELIARVPDNSEYIQNYLKVLENIMTYHLDAQKLEEEPVIFERIVQNYGRLFELVPGKLELFKKLQLLTEQFKNYCLLSRNFEAANTVFGQIEEIYSGILKKEPGHILVSAHLLFLYETSADLYTKLGKIEKAEESYLQALDFLSKKQRASPGNTTYVRQQGKVYRMLGRAFYEAGDSGKAAQYAGKALEILRELAGKNPEDLHYQYEISDDFTGLGKLFEDIGDIERAKECHMQEINIYRNIHERDPEDEVSEANIAATLDRIGHLYAGKGETETAKQYYEQGLEAYEKLSESYPEDIDHEVGIANTLGYIGKQYSDPEPETALKYYKKALGILEDVVQTFPDVPVYKEDLIQTLGDLESLASGQKQYENAILYRERITELSRQLASENPENLDYKKELALSFKHMGLLYEKAEKPEPAKQQYSKSADVFRQVLQNENEKDLMKGLLALDLQKQATILIHEKNYGLAKEYLVLLRDYYEALYEKDPEKPENWKAVCEIRTLCGILHKSMGNYDAAIQIYKSVFSVLNKHPVSDPDNPDYQSIIGVLYTQLGIAYHLADEYDKSKEAFEKSIPINVKLLDEETENFLHMGDMAVTFTEYSKLLTSMGMKKEAEEYAAKADEIKEKIMKKFRFDESTMFDESTIEDGDKKDL